MTPPATAASRPQALKREPLKQEGLQREPLQRRSAGARRTVVRHPRRISGPAGPVRGPAGAIARAAGLAGAVAVPAPGLPGRRGAQGAPGVALRTWAALDRASRSALVERVARGRLWIGLLAFALIGIVAMQLLVLKLNNEIGRTLQRQVSLEHQNAQFGIEASEASAGSLVEPQAAAAGMTFATPGTLHFLNASPAALHRALATLGKPIAPSVAPAEAAPPSRGVGAPPGEEPTSSEATAGASPPSAQGAGSTATTGG